MPRQSNADYVAIRNPVTRAAIGTKTMIECEFVVVVYHEALQASAEGVTQAQASVPGLVCPRVDTYRRGL
jgi:hypothetical protein